MKKSLFMIFVIFFLSLLSLVLVVNFATDSIKLPVLVIKISIIAHYVIIATLLVVSGFFMWVFLGFMEISKRMRIMIVTITYTLIVAAIVTYILWRT